MRYRLSCDKSRMGFVIQNWSQLKHDVDNAISTGRLCSEASLIIIGPTTEGVCVYVCVWHRYRENGRLLEKGEAMVAYVPGRFEIPDRIHKRVLH